MGHRCARIAIVLVAVALLSSCLRIDVAELASDEFDGRNNNTVGSVRAQDFLLGYMTDWLDGANGAATGIDAYKQPFDAGTNLVGVLPGTDLADEYVLIGAHYDGRGQNCRDVRPGDVICNGATDNAAGVAAVLQVARAFAFAPEPPRRSIIFAFWDREEDGLVGSRYYAQNPLLPIAQTVAYVNLDIQGANLRPSLRNFSFAIGAETGGTRLQQLVDAAIAPGTLDTRDVSVIFGQGRSDHVSLIAAGVPSVFFSDATGPCYHTDADDIDIVDFDKLGQQTQIVQRLMRELASTDVLPVFSSSNPLATFADAVVLTDAIDLLQADLDMFTPAQAAQLTAFRDELHAIVDAGPAAFDSAEIGRLLSIAVTAVGYFTTGACDGYLAP